MRLRSARSSHVHSVQSDQGVFDKVADVATEEVLGALDVAGVETEDTLDRFEFVSDSAIPAAAVEVSAAKFDALVVLDEFKAKVVLVVVLSVVAIG